MASQNSLRQASRILQNSRLHVKPTQIRHHSAQSLLTSRPSSRIHHSSIRAFPSRSIQQTRGFSLWPSSKPADIPHSDVQITTPSDLDQVRTIKANNTSAEISFESHPPNNFEPQIIENAQQGLLEPHGTEPVVLALEDIPERIGYLREVCGLDFGWGPTSTMEWVLEHLHIWGGLSWTAAIVALGFTLRATMLPFLIQSADMSAKMREVSAVTEPIKAKYKLAAMQRDQMKMQQYMMEQRAIYSDAGIKFSKLIYPLAIQLMFGFGAWRTLRNCATLPVPGFVTESWLWLNDLTFSDPYFILPAVSSGLIFITMRTNTKVNMPSGSSAAAAGGLANPHMMNIMSYFLPCLSFVFMVWQPGAVQAYFVASSACGLATAKLLASNPFRRLVGIPPVGGHTPQSAHPGPNVDGPAGATSSKPQPNPFLRERSRVIETTGRTVPTEQPTPSQPAEPQPNISAIDKGVDSIKKRWDEIKSSSQKMTLFGSTPEQRAKENQKAANERALARRKAELEALRRESNRELGVEEEEDDSDDKRRRRR
ncbi:hypothetical protein LTS08_004795 [Lithohypha guttulata]|nr:hypothetical protein LTS08_004795 [Lithohypha guttulata]